MKAILCKTFGLKPSDLETEDGVELLKMLAALNLFESVAAEKAAAKARLAGGLGRRGRRR